MVYSSALPNIGYSNRNPPIPLLHPNFTQLVRDANNTELIVSFALSLAFSLANVTLERNSTETPTTDSRDEFKGS